MRISVLFLLLGSLLLAQRAHAADIIWYSFSAIEADAGFVDLLQSAGHNVTRVQEMAPTEPAFLSTLNTADLVIASRSHNSGNVLGATNMPIWNEQITVPVMIMSAYVIRNNRLGWITGNDVPDVQTTTALVAVDPAHPVFNGIAFQADGVTMVEDYNVVIDRGISTPNSLPASGGTIIATNPAITSGSGGFAIAEWPAGATVTEETGISAVLGGPRYFFAGGSREVGGTGMGVDTAGKFDLTAAGSQLLLNFVDYIVGSEPLIPGDFNNDGVVNGLDYDILVNNLGGHLDGPVGRAQGDMNFDGRIDLTDFGLFKEIFPGALGQGAAVPEPSTLALVMCALAGLWLARRRRP